MRALDEPVVVVRHRRDVHHALDEVLDQLDEQPERRDAGDVAFEFVADLVRHEADLLPLDQLALRLVGAALPFRRVTRDVGQIFRQLFAPIGVHPAVPRFTQRTVHDEIRITADRRREMGVARRRQPEVPEVRRVVARLLHRPQHEKRDRLLFRFAVNLLDEVLEMARPYRVGGRREAVAERPHEFLELLDFQRVRRLVNAIQRRDAVPVEVLRDRLVRDEHELLDQPVGDVPLRRDDFLDHALVVENDLRLLQIEIDRSAAAPAVVQNLVQLVHRLEHLHDIRVAGGDGGIRLRQDRVDVGVGHPRVAVDDAVVDLVADDVAVAIDLHQTGLHEPVDVRVEAA